MNKTGIAYLDFAWNPCGFGCSHGCPTCFARRQATSTGPTAPKCPDCRAFLFHFHPERLERKLSPAGHRKPAVIGVQFLGDLFDELRPSGEIYGVLAAVYAAPQHTYVFLTQRPAKAAIHLMEWYSTGGGGHVTGGGLPRNWNVGCTIKGPGPQAMEDIAALCQIRGRLWLSLEPLAGNVEFYH